MKFENMIQTDLSLKYIYQSAREDVVNPRLLLLLHGYGSNEADLFTFAAELPDDFFIVSAQAPRRIQYGGYSWYDINFTNSEKFNNTEQAIESIDLIRKFKEECIEKFSLNKNEVWLAGFSQGAILCYALTLQKQENIKRVLCMSGYPSLDIIGETFQDNYADLAIFISHGTEDAVIPIQWARKAETLLNELGIEHEYHEYRSGHGLIPQNFYDMLDWINRHK